MKTDNSFFSFQRLNLFLRSSFLGYLTSGRGIDSIYGYRLYYASCKIDFHVNIYGSHVKVETLNVRHWKHRFKACNFALF